MSSSGWATARPRAHARAHGSRPRALAKRIARKRGHVAHRSRGRSAREKCVSAERPPRVKARALAVRLEKANRPLTASRSSVAPRERTRAVAARATMKAPGCSKCRYAARGCRRCVANFVTASEAREKKAKAAEARVAKKASASAAAKRDKAEVAASPGAKRPRGRPLGSKNGEKKATAMGGAGAAKQELSRAHESGSNHPKTPSLARAPLDEKTSANGERRGPTRASFVSPPSTAKSVGDGATAAAARAAIASVSADAQEHARIERGTADARDTTRHDDRAERVAKKVRWGPSSPAGPGVSSPTRLAPGALTSSKTISSDPREDDMGALAQRLAEYVGSYGSMDARDLLGVPCGGQMLCDALARAAADTSRF